jgi:hypothetical protein
MPDASEYASRPDLAARVAELEAEVAELRAANEALVSRETEHDVSRETEQPKRGGRGQGGRAHPPKIVGT